MGKSSSRGYWEDLSDAAMNDGDAVSARRAWLIANNLAHAVDESTQHRVNWSAQLTGNSSTDGSSFRTKTGNDDPRIYAQPFPMTMVVQGKPVNLDIEIQGRTTDSTASSVYMKAKVISDSGAVGDDTADTYWETNTVSTASTVAAVLISTQVFLTVTSFPGYPNTRGRWSVVENGETHYPLIHMARIEVAVWTTHSDAAGDIMSVLVREFV